MKGNVFLVFVIFLGISQSASSLYLNTRCKDHSHCATSPFLQCLNGYCQCDSRSQVYDGNFQKCTLRAGAQCFNPGNNNQQNNNFNQVNPWLLIQCSQNSACINGVCECQPGYSYSNSEFICKPNFQHVCLQASDCDLSKGLACIDGRCQCQNATLSYQGLFGCVDNRDPNFVEMITTLKRTEQLFSENRIDIQEIMAVIDPAGESSGNPMEMEQLIQSRQLFQDSGNSNGNTYGNSLTDLAGAAQNTVPQQQPGLGGLLNFFSTLGTLSQTLGGLGGSPAAPAAPAAAGAPAGNPFSFFTNMLNAFNRIVPVIRQFKMFINPLRIYRKLVMNFRNLRTQFGGNNAATPAPAAAAALGGYPASVAPAAGGYPASGVPAAGGYPSAVPATSYGATVPVPAALVSLTTSSEQTFQAQQQQQQQAQPSTLQNYQASFQGTLQFPQGVAQQFQSPSPSVLQTQAATQNLHFIANQNPHHNQLVPAAANNEYRFQQQAVQRPAAVAAATHPQQISGFNSNNDNTNVNYNQQKPLEQSTSNNKYPRQERFSYNYGDNSNLEDSSPYLPEHL